MQKVRFVEFIDNLEQSLLDIILSGLDHGQVRSDHVLLFSACDCVVMLQDCLVEY